MSGPKSAAKNAGMSNDFDCEICLFPFDTESRCPRILTKCGHTVCQDCAMKLWVRGDYRQVTCPFDRISTIFHTSIKDLRKNFTVERLLSSKKTEVVTPTQIPTGRCSRDSSHEAWFTCKDCEADFCESCFDNNHYFYKPCEPIDSVKIPSIDKPHQAPRCKKHPINFADFVCQDPACEIEDKVVCNTCLLREHKGHKNERIEGIVAKNQKKLKEELIKKTFLDDPERYIDNSEYEDIKGSQETSLRNHNQLIKQISDHYDNEKSKAIEEFERQFTQNQAMATKVLEEEQTVPRDQKALREIRDEIRGRLISKKKLEDVEDLVERHQSACKASDSKIMSLFPMVSALRDISFTLPQFAQRVFDPRQPSTSNSSEANN